MRKRRHHYVAQFYLRAWEVDGAVACWRNGRTFSTGTRDLAVRTDYYELKEMTEIELAFVKKVCFENADSFLVSLNRGWLTGFVGPFVLRRLAAEMGSETPEIAEAIELHLSNAEEDLHMEMEQGGSVFVHSLRNGDFAFLESEDVGQFLHFLTVQYFRTPNTKARATWALEGLPEVRVDHIWGVMSHIFATNVALGLFRRREETLFSLLRAPAGEEFITADLPVYNRHEIGTEPFQKIERLAFYYPVSPHLALLVDPDAAAQGVEERELTADEVRKLNRDMLSIAHEQASPPTSNCCRIFTLFPSRASPRQRGSGRGLCSHASQHVPRGLPRDPQFLWDCGSRSSWIRISGTLGLWWRVTRSPSGRRCEESARVGGSRSSPETSSEIVK